MTKVKSMDFPSSAIKQNKLEWKPRCFGEYQGIGDDCCFFCRLSFKCGDKSLKKKYPNKSQNKPNKRMRCR